MSRAWILGGLLLIGTATSSVGQSAFPFNDREFEIPITISKGHQSRIDHLELFYSIDRGKTWQRGPQARPDEKSFAFTARSDGEHWFVVLVVDKLGTRQPKDPYNAPVGQRILIDTLKPELELTTLKRDSSDPNLVQVGWEVQEENPNFSSMKLEYQSQSSTQWVTVPIAKVRRGEHRVNVGPEPATFRLTLRDTAENSSTVTAQINRAPSSFVASRSSDKGTPPPPPSGSFSTLPRPSGVEEASGTSDIKKLMPPTVTPPPVTRIPMVPPTVETRERALASTPGSGTPPTPRSDWSTPSVPVVSNARITMQYEVSRYGPSGLGGADLYVTRDDGKTWMMLRNVQHTRGVAGSELDPRSSGVLKRTLSVTLQEEGFYGFYLVVKSGAGLSKPAPRAGTPPQMRLILDTTLPKAALYPVKAHPQQQHALVLKWQATDQHLTSKPISIQWSPQPSGPWETIGQTEMANTGSYIWNVPANTPAKVYLRLTVRDRGGNAAVAQTREPILIDLHTPEVQSLRLIN